jgi:hypothetical protein
LLLHQQQLYLPCLPAFLHQQLFLLHRFLPHRQLLLPSQLQAVQLPLPAFKSIRARLSETHLAAF